MIRRPPRSTLFPTRRSSDLIGNRPFMQFWNVFYGTFHFVVTAFAMIWTYLRFPERYALWRNVLACTDRKSTRLKSSHAKISYAVFCLKKKNATAQRARPH